MRPTAHDGVAAVPSCIEVHAALPSHLRSVFVGCSINSPRDLTPELSRPATGWRTRASVAQARGRRHDAGSA